MAIHIKVVYSLDTDSFINALQRFIARRACPEQIKSDNGGNFVKGESELCEALQAWNQAQIHEYVLQHDIKWIFSPPAASHHRGVWERCIRTVRKVMKALLKQQVLDDESLDKLMCEVESIINGRVITKYLTIQGISMHSHLIISCYFKRDSNPTWCIFHRG